MHRMPATVLACLALAAGGALSACGDDEPAGDAGPATTTTAPASGAAASGEVKVTMKDIKFVPEQISAKVGQKIVWENTDGQIPHTVTAREGADFDSGTMQAGATFSYTPTKAGTIDYVCTIHPGQDGKLIVTK